MGVCTSFVEPLNLECILVNNFAGSTAMFTALAFIIISFFAAKFRMPNEIALIMFALFTVFMSTYLQGIYVLGILLIGVITFYSVSKLVKN